MPARDLRGELRSVRHALGLRQERKGKELAVEAEK
jgi:hypothetical protein